MSLNSQIENSVIGFYVIPWKPVPKSFNIERPDDLFNVSQVQSLIPKTRPLNFFKYIEFFENIAQILNSIEFIIK